MDEPMWRCNYVSVRSRHSVPQRHPPVPVRHLGDAPLRHHWVFIWDLFGTSQGRILQTSSWRSSMTSWRRTSETSWRRTTEMSLGVSFETSLRRHWDVSRDAAATSPRRLLAGWVDPFNFIQSCLFLSFSSLILSPAGIRENGTNAQKLYYLVQFQTLASKHVPPKWNILYDRQRWTESRHCSCQSVRDIWNIIITKNYRTI